MEMNVQGNNTTKIIVIMYILIIQSGFSFLHSCEKIVYMSNNASESIWVFILKVFLSLRSLTPFREPEGF